MRSLIMMCVCVTACASHSNPPAPAPRVVGDSAVRVRFGERFSPETGMAALKAFVPDVAASDSGGECTLRRLPSSTAHSVTASFPNSQNARMTATMTFDVNGKLVTYAETRGVARIKGGTLGMSEIQRDSALKAAHDAVRSTIITLNFALDQGIVHNQGGGLPSHAVLATEHDVEVLPILGLRERMARFRKLCGV